MTHVEETSSKQYLLRSSRACRIHDDEWESRKHILKKLYLEDDLSRQDIIRIMANQHAFHISEKQLKHRLGRRGIKKYFRKQDMAIMLALQDKCRAAGSHVRFEYEGKEIGQERMKRAVKRCKIPLSVDSVLPPYIHAYACPLQSQANDLASEPRGLLSDHFSPPPSAPSELHVERRIPEVSTFDHDCEATEWATEIKGFREFSPPEALTHMTTRHLPASAVMHSSNAFACEVVDRSQITNDTRIERGLASQQIHFAFEDSTAHSGSINSPPGTASDWSSFVHLPSSTPMSSDAVRTNREGTPIMIFERSPSRGITATPKDSGHDRKLVEPNTSIPRVDFSFDPSMRSVNSSLAYVHEIIVPLQLLFSITHNPVDQIILTSSGGKNKPFRELFDLLHSEWFRQEMLNLLCHYYENAAKVIRTPQQANYETGSAAYNGQPFLCPMSSNFLDAESRRRRAQRSGSRVESYALIETPVGFINVQLRGTIQGNASNTASENSQNLRMAFMPAASERTFGILAIFEGPRNATGMPSIPATLKSFNVVPQHSEIIQCVSCNDVQGVQNLFNKAEASPFDVDPQGYSLLSYAIDFGCSDVFLMLLRGGAGTQNCNLYGESFDIIWTIWFRYIDHISHLLTLYYTVSPSRRPIEDFDQCLQMTRAAIANGHDIEDTTACDHDRASPLFEVSEFWSLDLAHSTAPEKVLRFLIGIGYDMEKRNTFGLTALLAATQSYRPQVIKCIKTLVGHGADINAVDFGGRGALHLALIGPANLYGWRQLRHSLLTKDDVCDYMWPLKIVYHTEDETAEIVISSGLTTIRYEAYPLKLPKTPGSLRQTVDSQFEPTQHSEVNMDSEDDILFSEFNIHDDGLNETCRAPENDHIVEHVICKDYYGVEHCIRHPIQVLKARLRAILVTLLQGGCDPNALDEKGISPSEYAERDGIWPQWSWALENAGYMFSIESKLWVKVPHD